MKTDEDEDQSPTLLALALALALTLTMAGRNAAAASAAASCKADRRSLVSGGDACCRQQQVAPGRPDRRPPVAPAGGETWRRVASPSPPLPSPGQWGRGGGVGGVGVGGGGGGGAGLGQWQWCPREQPLGVASGSGCGQLRSASEPRYKRSSRSSSQQTDSPRRPSLRDPQHAEPGSGNSRSRS
ncbi:homeobox protein Hox-D9-like [Schistocerca piceifrons]|uniref:homeobox protein Hox-D9-like n=1 Tax=Schistocerca piceifrons TaxID=274613 RepID=UPI001F5EE81D|nr:homeobox protein Hox-D9-like [Schistocerca piceifrons]